MRIAFIGAGNMGEAMIAAVLRQGAVVRDAVYACDIDQSRLDAVAGKYEVSCTREIGRATEDADIVVLSVKPAALPKVLKDLKGKLKGDQAVLSIVAGARIETISRGLEHEAIVRVMPNTPAQVGEGISVWTATDAVGKQHRDAVQTILIAMGDEVYVTDEKYIDMATAVSGSGPAYVFLMMEALIDAAVHIGLPRDTAGKLVTQTVLGSARMTKETGRHPVDLKNMVTSPGGTTAEGLLCLEEGGVRAAIAQAVIAAYDKAKLLGNDSK